MPFQSPPFWCLMTTQVVTTQKASKISTELPLDMCNTQNVFEYTSAHNLGSTLPLDFTNPASKDIYKERLAHINDMNKET